MSTRITLFSKLLSMLLSVVCFCGCQTGSIASEKEAMPEIRVYSLNDPSGAYRVLESTDTKMIAESLHAMAPRYEKIRPVFTHKIELIEDNQTSVWLINKTGYMTVENDSKHILYKFDNPVIFFKSS